MKYHAIKPNRPTLRTDYLFIDTYAVNLRPFFTRITRYGLSIFALNLFTLTSFLIALFFICD